MHIPAKVTVMGLGLFGGGLGAAEFFARRGSRVLVTDMKGEEALRPSIEKLNGLPIEYCLGEHRERDFAETDLVVASPAVPRTSPFLQTARKHGVPLETEISLFFKMCRAPIVGVTGSIGKTTTTSLIGAMLANGMRKVHVGGNIGRSLLSDAESIAPGDIVVLELSSFQLEWLGEAALSPAVAVVTNIHPNHLDRHGTMQNYIAAKRNIVSNQKPAGAAVLNLDDPEIRTWADGLRGECLCFSTVEEPRSGSFVRGGRIMLRRNGTETEIAEADCLRLPGRHNVANALAAVAACSVAGAAPAAMSKGLAQFEGIEHRLELVCRRNGVLYYNDSKATTPESAMAALDAFDSPIVLIAGGYDKKVPLDKFAEKVFRRARVAILLGKTADTLGRLLDQYSRDGFRWLRVQSLEEAVARAASLADSGDVVLLSPACASYDMFTNYEERGNKFKEMCRAL